VPPKPGQFQLGLLWQLLEKLPSDYNLGNYGDKPSDNSDIKPRPAPVRGEESCGKMPADWRQQLLRHIEARRLDRVCPAFLCKNTPPAFSCTALPSLSTCREA